MDSPEFASRLPSPTEDPEGALVAAVTLRGLAERLEEAAVRAAINDGWSWAQIAQSLGVTRQAAHKKHARSQPKTTRPTTSTKKKDKKEPST